MLKAVLRITLTSFLIIVSGCSTSLLSPEATEQWREPQPTDELKAAMAVWIENQKLCQSVIANGQPCPQPNPPISFVYGAPVSSRQAGFRGGLETMATIGQAIIPLAIGALTGAGIAGAVP